MSRIELEGQVTNEAERKISSMSRIVDTITSASGRIVMTLPGLAGDDEAADIHSATFAFGIAAFNETKNSDGTFLYKRRASAAPALSTIGQMAEESATAPLGQTDVGAGKSEIRRYARLLGISASISSVSAAGAKRRIDDYLNKGSFKQIITSYGGTNFTASDLMGSTFTRGGHRDDQYRATGVAAFKENCRLVDNELRNLGIDPGSLTVGGIDHILLTGKITGLNGNVMDLRRSDPYITWLLKEKKEQLKVQRYAGQAASGTKPKALRSVANAWINEAMSGTDVETGLRFAKSTVTAAKLTKATMKGAVAVGGIAASQATRLSTNALITAGTNIALGVSKLIGDQTLIQKAAHLRASGEIAKSEIRDAATRTTKNSAMLFFNGGTRRVIKNGYTRIMTSVPVTTLKANIANSRPVQAIKNSAVGRAYTNAKAKVTAIRNRLNIFKGRLDAVRNKISQSLIGKALAAPKKIVSGISTALNGLKKAALAGVAVVILIPVLFVPILGAVSALFSSAFETAAAVCDWWDSLWPDREPAELDTAGSLALDAMRMVMANYIAADPALASATYYSRLESDSVNYCSNSKLRALYAEYEEKLDEYNAAVVRYERELAEYYTSPSYLAYAEEMNAWAIAFSEAYARWLEETDEYARMHAWFTYDVPSPEPPPMPEPPEGPPSLREIASEAGYVDETAAAIEAMYPGLFSMEYAQYTGESSDAWTKQEYAERYAALNGSAPKGSLAYETKYNYALTQIHKELPVRTEIPYLDEMRTPGTTPVPYSVDQLFKGIICLATVHVENDCYDTQEFVDYCVELLYDVLESSQYKAEEIPYSGYSYLNPIYYTPNKETVDWGEGIIHVALGEIGLNKLAVADSSIRDQLLLSDDLSQLDYFEWARINYELSDEDWLSLGLNFLWNSALDSYKSNFPEEQVISATESGSVRKNNLANYSGTSMSLDSWKRRIRNNAYISDATKDAVIYALEKSNGRSRYDQSRRMEEGYYDCSSLVFRAYQAARVDISYYGNSYNVEAITTPYRGETTAAAICQGLVSNGRWFTATSIYQLRPGDLIFYGDAKQSNGRFLGIDHVAMYIGDVGGVGYIVEADGAGVCTSPLWNYTSPARALIVCRPL